MISREKTSEEIEDLKHNKNQSENDESCDQETTNFLKVKRKPKKEKMSESKYRIDSLNKKVKAKFFTMLHQTLSLFLTKKLPKIPQSVVTNVSIQFNKDLLLKPIKQIYRESVIFPNDEELKKMIAVNKQLEFFNILDTKFSAAFENYLTCPIFKNHLREILNKNGGDYKDTFEEECRKFVEYYSKAKPRK
jgi:hypothetical protein